MKYLVSLLLGVITGSLLFLTVLYLNPFTAKSSVSPLALSDEEIIDLTFNAAPADTLLFTNNGESLIDPHPDRVAVLWEDAVNQSWVSAVRLTNARGEIQGIGIKFSSPSEETRILGAKALVNSAWHIYLPHRGTLFVYQTENYWAYMRDIVIPAKLSMGDSWRGSWHRSITSGPGALGTARVIGESGVFNGISTEAVESLTARAYSSSAGPVAMTGNLTIAMPSETARAGFESTP